MVSGFAAQCCGPAFFVYGKAAEGDVGRGRWDGSWVARVKSLRVKQRRRNDTREARGKGKKDVFLSLEKRLKGYLLVLWVEVEAGPQLSRP